MEKCGVEQRHMVGKWHVGHGHHWMLPWNRGFQTFAGFSSKIIFRGLNVPKKIFKISLKEITVFSQTFRVFGGC